MIFRSRFVAFTEVSPNVAISVDAVCHIEADATNPNACIVATKERRFWVPVAYATVVDRFQNAELHDK